MFKPTIAIALLAVAGGAIASGVFKPHPDTWVFVSNTDPGSVNGSDEWFAFKANIMGTHSYEVVFAVTDYFWCTGDATQDPSWTLAYQNIVWPENTWHDTFDEWADMDYGQNMNDVWFWTTDGGTETFEDTTTSTYAARTYGTKYTRSLGYVVTSGDGGLGGGGG